MISEMTSEYLAESLRTRRFKMLRQQFRDTDAADLAEAFKELSMGEFVSCFRLVPKEKRAELFAHLEFERQEELIEELPDNVISSILDEMEPDDRTALLEHLPFEIRSQILLKLSPEERRVAWQLLSYPEESVGRLMTPEVLFLKSNTKVDEALAQLRWGHDYPEEQLHHLFVTDSQGLFLGDISLAALVLADPSTIPISEIMNPSRVALNATDDQETAVDFFRKYDRHILPVVDQDGILKGAITADDVFDVAEEEATEDIQQFGGQGVLEDSYFQSTMLTLFRKRAGWLALLFIGGILTGGLLRHYEALTAEMAWLVFFFPLIISSGGNSGSQAASLIIRGLAIREMELKNWKSVALREIVVGSALGVALGALGFATAQVWGLSMLIGVVVAVSILGVVIFGAVTGAMLPFIFKRMNLDPAVSSSPLLASLVDIFGVLIFYNVARWIIHSYS